MTLNIENKSEEIVCGFVTIPTDNPEYDQQFDFQMPDNEQSHSVEIPSNTYTVILVSCSGEIIQSYPNTAITEDMTITYSGMSKTDTPQPVNLPSLSNTSDEPVCQVVVAPEISGEVEGFLPESMHSMTSDNQTLEITILQGEYLIGVFDCDNNLLAGLRNISIYEQLSVSYPEQTNDYETAYRLVEAGVDAYIDHPTMINATIAFDEALTLYESLENRAMQSILMRYLGDAMLARDDLDNALTRYEEAFSIQSELNIAEARTITLSRLGNIYEQQAGLLPGSTGYL